MEDNLAITFVLPVLNETDSLVTTVETIRRVAGPHVAELLVIVADRTTPESHAVARQLLEAYPDQVRIHTQRLPRLGGAMQEAFAEARGRHIMLMATDLETDPEAIPLFLAPMLRGECDIVAGSRWLSGGGFEGYGRSKVLANWLFQQFFRVFYGTRLTDLTYAYRLYRADVLRGIVWEQLGHPFLMECLIKPLRLGAKVIEVPCVWRRRAAGASANSIRQMFQYVPLALRVRWMARRRIRENG